jgi:hypothetical protein
MGLAIAPRYWTVAQGPNGPEPVTDGEQLVLMNHGWALIDAALRSYCTNLAGISLSPGNPADASLLSDQNASLKAG